MGGKITTGLNLDMNELKELFIRAKNADAKMLAIQYKIDGFKDLETIIIKKSAFDNMFSKITRDYDDCLYHKTEDIFICNYTFGDTYRDLISELY